MKIRYKIYLILSFIYLCIAIGYLYFLWNFDCDGLGCLSIIFATGPIAIVFMIPFLWMLLKAFNWFRKPLNEKQWNQNMHSAMLVAGIPFWLFTAILIFVLANSLS